MNTPYSRRDLLKGGGYALAVSLAGCFSPGPPESGEIVSTYTIGDEEWAEKYNTLQIIGRVDGAEKFNKSFQLPASVQFDVEAATYEIITKINGEIVGTYEWEVTRCRAILQIELYDNMWMKFDTSDC